MVELSNFEPIWRPSHDFPIIPGSPEKIPVYDDTGIRFKFLIRRIFLRMKQGCDGKPTKIPNYVLLSANC